MPVAQISPSLGNPIRAILNPRRVPFGDFYINRLEGARIALVRGHDVVAVTVVPEELPADAYIDVVRLTAPGHPYDGAIAITNTGDVERVVDLRAAGKYDEDLELVVIGGLINVITRTDLGMGVERISPQPEMLEFVVEWYRARRAADASFHLDELDALVDDAGCADADCPVHGTGVPLAEFLNVMQIAVPGCAPLLLRGVEVLNLSFSAADYPGARVKRHRLVAHGHPHHGGFITGDYGSGTTIKRVYEAQKTGTKGTANLEEYALMAMFSAGLGVPLPGSRHFVRR